jgi:hypothetical protein
MVICCARRSCAAAGSAEAIIERANAQTIARPFRF